jgi:hypothetical protein
MATLLAEMLERRRERERETQAMVVAKLESS